MRPEFMIEEYFERRYEVSLIVNRWKSQDEAF